ncbi:MAG: hypothetical protein ACRD5R_00665 [Candidatus Acidiferrales bacterium]
MMILKAHGAIFMPSDGLLITADGAQEKRGGKLTCESRETDNAKEIRGEWKCEHSISCRARIERVMIMMRRIIHGRTFRRTEE